MKKVIRLTESDLNRIVKKLIKENEEESDWWTKFGFDSEESFVEDYIVADEYAEKLFWDADEEIKEIMYNFFDNVNIGNIIEKYQNEFKERYPQYSNPKETFHNEFITDLMNGDANYNPELLVDKIQDNLIDFLFYKR